MTDIQNKRHFHIPAYLRCRTCGRYIPQSEAKAGGFCSDECAVVFSRCITCGSYFPSNKGFRKLYCSPDCAVQYKLEYLSGERDTLQITEVQQ